jgi:hypothetical protein
MMSNVMSNRRGNIAKQIFLSLGLFFSFSQLSAMCPQTVGPVVPGEAIWRVASRIGEALNVVQSQICALQATAPATAGIDCTFIFGQEDIGPGGVYIISVPGTYCMKETVTLTSGSGITVNSNDVTIDLQGHTINGAGNSTTAIELGDGVQNVIIQNGIIENLGGVSPDGIGIRDTVGNVTTLENITIQNVNFNNNSVAAISFNQAAAGTYDVDGMLIRNCRSDNSGQIFVQGISGIVEGCEVHENRGAGIQGGITAQGPTSAVLATNFVIRDCISTSSFGSNLIPIEIINTNNATVQNCVAQGGLTGFGPGNNSSGIFIYVYTNAFISDCVVEGCFRGFNVTVPLGGGSLTIERCAALGTAFLGFEVDSYDIVSPTKLIDCVAEDCGFWGFLLFHQGFGGTLSDVIYKGCCATGCSASGFAAFAFSSPTTISHLLYEDCVAQSNAGHGFELIAGAFDFSLGINIVNDAIFHNCTAQNNAFDGFAIGMNDPQGQNDNTGPIYDVVCRNCIAEANARDGFSFGSTVTASTILDCCAMNNTVTGINNLPGDTNAVLGNSAFNNFGGDIYGVSDPSLLVSRSIMGRLAGAFRWVNAIS